jgi:hypothetical protein
MDGWRQEGEGNAEVDEKNPLPVNRSRDGGVETGEEGRWLEG